jgi:hypothetical protein
MTANVQYSLVAGGCLAHAAICILLFPHVPIWLSLFIFAAWPPWIFALWRFRWAKMILPLVIGFMILYRVFWMLPRH